MGTMSSRGAVVLVVVLIVVTVVLIIVVVVLLLLVIVLPIAVVVLPVAVVVIVVFRIRIRPLLPFNSGGVRGVGHGGGSRTFGGSDSDAAPLELLLGPTVQIN